MSQIYYRKCKNGICLTLATVLVFAGGCEKNENKTKASSLLIGKELTILITEDMVVDASFIVKMNKGEIEYKRSGQSFKQPFFDMIRTEECNKLIDYMVSNQLVIEPGKYVIHQSWSSEKIIENLRFRKQEVK